ncbi:DJ-1/PfpI family protein [Clostridium sp.]|uniref:DJ-1/PfpI family protein n=1 Tax=Clostridium sp. TaxID=1506 RepID=UPI003464D618
MNVCVLYYHGFCEFEVVLTFAKFMDNIISVALEDRIYISEEKQKYLPDKTVQELNPDNIDLFIIPGGNPTHLYENTELREFITALNEKNKFIAGICGGVELMARFGVLDNKKCTGDSEGIKLDEENKEFFKKATIVNEDIVIDRNCITSIGKAFIEFSIELGKLMNVYKSDEEIKEDYNWFKNIKDKI